MNYCLLNLIYKFCISSPKMKAMNTLHHILEIVEIWGLSSLQNRLVR